MRLLRSPALVSWRHELRCTDDGEGVDAALIDSRLGALGVAPPKEGQRGLFGRGLRECRRIYERGHLDLTARRAERLAIACGDAVNAEVVRYLNRLSDLLFILSRGANGGEEPLWEPGRYR
jgi:Cobalamin adenosyltransferase